MVMLPTIILRFIKAMSVNKLEIVQKYLTLDLEQRLKNSNNLAWNLHDSLLDMEMYYDLFPYNQIGFHPLNPVFITYLNNFENIAKVPFVLCADSAHRLYWFFQRVLPSKNMPLLLLNIDLAGIVPDYWRDAVCFFSVRVKKTSSEITQYLSHGIINYDTYSSQLNEEIELSRYKKYFLYLSSRKEEYNKSQETMALTQKIYELMKLTGKEIFIVDQKKCFKLDGLRNTVIAQINNRFSHYSYDLLDDRLFSKGATPIKSEKNNLTPSLEQRISFFHFVDMYEVEGVDTGNLLEEIDELGISAGEFGDAFIANFLKDKLLFKYYS